jgi:hypothetical protein
MLRLTLLKAVFTILAIFNMFLPIFNPTSIGLSSLFQWVIVAIHFIGLLNGIGYFNQWVPLVPLFFVRVGEVLFYVFLSKKDIYWPVFSIVLIVDMLFILLLLMTKSKYKIERIVE